MYLSEQELEHREVRFLTTGRACLTFVLEGDFIILGRTPIFSSLWRTILSSKTVSVAEASVEQTGKEASVSACKRSKNLRPVKNCLPTTDTDDPN